MLIKGYKKAKIQDELNRNRTNQKKFWGNIREIWPKTKNSVIHTLGEENGDEIFEGTELAEHINNFLPQ